MISHGITGVILVVIVGVLIIISPSICYHQEILSSENTGAGTDIAVNTDASIHLSSSKDNQKNNRISQERDQKERKELE